MHHTSCCCICCWFCLQARALTAPCIPWKWEENCICFLSQGWVRKRKVAHRGPVKLTFSQWVYISTNQISGVPHISPLSRLALPLCWSISLHDDPCYISHIQASFPHWLWQGQTLNDERLMSQLKKWKLNTCMSETLKGTPQSLVCWYRCRWGFLSWVQGRGMEAGRSPVCERKAELFEHSFKHPGVVGRNVLTLSFNFQSKDFFFNWNLKIHLRNVPFFCLCIPLSAPSHTIENRAKG